MDETKGNSAPLMYCLTTEEKGKQIIFMGPGGLKNATIVEGRNKRSEMFQ